MPKPQIPDHVKREAVVLEDLRLAYVPVPKAASTSILWALAELVGSPASDRVRSRKLEVTRSATVHDGLMWESAQKLRGRSEEELEWILHSDDWFRFTVVRDPARRIWSAWVSKVLVREPRFVGMFGDDWFPAVPSTATDVLESFRHFVSGLPSRPDWTDPHWSTQAELAGVSDICYSLIGRVEQLGRAEADLRAYMSRRGATLPQLETENRSFLPFSPGLFDRVTHEACDRWTARDRETFGYEPVPYSGGEPDEQWYGAVEATIPAIRALIEHNERFLDVWRWKKGADPTRSHRSRKRELGLGIAAAVTVSALLAVARSS